jgi:hypothetical protein
MAVEKSSKQLYCKQYLKREFRFTRAALLPKTKLADQDNHEPDNGW